MLIYFSPLQNAQAKAEQAEKFAQSAQVLAELGSKLVNEVGNRADKLEQIELNKFASISSEKNSVHQQLSQIQASISSLSLRLNNLQDPVPTAKDISGDPFSKAVIITLSILSGLLFAWAVWATFFTGSDQAALDEVKTKLEIAQNQLRSEKNQSDEQGEQIDKLNKQNNEHHQKIKEICKKVSGLKDDKKSGEIKEVKELCKDQN